MSVMEQVKNLAQTAKFVQSVLDAKDEQSIREKIAASSGTNTAQQLRMMEKRDGDWIRHSLAVPRRRGDRVTELSHVKRSNFGISIRGRQTTPYSLNFADTTLGGNRSLNPRPQFTRHADPNIRQLWYNGASGRGMGVNYAENIDQNAQRIYLQFGTPSFNSMTGYVSRMYDRKHANMVNKGRVDMLLFRAGQAVSMVLLLATVPLVFIGLNVLSMTSNLITRLYKTLTRAPSSRYYYLTPTMPLYWTSLQTMCNMLFVNMQLTEGFGLNEQLRDLNREGGAKGVTDADLTDAQKLRALMINEDDEGGFEDPNNKFNSAIEEVRAEFEAVKKFGKETPYSQANSREITTSITDILPDIFASKDGGLDVRRVATRYQRLANFHQKKLADILDTATDIEDVVSRLEDYFSLKSPTPPELHDATTLEQYMRRYIGTAYYKSIIDGSEDKADDAHKAAVIFDENAKLAKKRASSNAEEDHSIRDLDSTPDESTLPSSVVQAMMKSADASTAEIRAEADAQAALYWQKRADAVKSGDYESMIEAELRDGSAFVSFIVDYQGTASESFSNSFATSSLAESVNSMSSSNRNRIFDFFGGNITDNVLGNMVEKIGGALAEMAMGALDMIGLKGLGVVAGGALADVPEHWANSTAQWGSSSYTISLRSPYGHPYALMHHCFFPLLALMAGALPRSTGNQSYGPPLYCKLWSQGRCQYQAAMIESISITRATSNIGWNVFGQAHGIDVSFEIRNLSNIMHVPIAINNSTSLKDALGFSLFDDESNFTDYMASLAGLGIADQHYIRPRWRLRRRQAQQQFDTWLSMSNFTQYMVGSFGIGNFKPGQIMSAIAAEASLRESW